MDYLRSLVGVSPSASAAAAKKKKPNAVLARKQQAAQEKPHHERLASSAKAQKLQLSQLQEDVDDMNTKLKLAVEVGDRRTAATYLAERNAIQADMTIRQKKLANTRAQLQAIETANSNLEHGLLLREGAEELTNVVAAMETIDVASAVGDIQEAAGMVEEHNVLLTEPILGTDDGGDDAVNAELDALMGVKLPSAPGHTPKATTHVAAAAVKKGGKEEL